MNYFGQLKGGIFLKLECRMRSCKLSALRFLSESILLLMGRLENLKFRCWPGSRQQILLPDFFIVGAQKSGTTSLAAWLDQLPGFNISRMNVLDKKRQRWEIQFFNNPMARIKGLPWYSSKFAQGLINGDKTPEYLFRKSALREIKRCCPDSRIIIMLRNPVDRAFSAYKHYCRVFPRSRNWDWLLPERSFEDNLKAEEYAGFPVGLLARGRYAEQLEYVYKVFSREQVRVVIFERFVSDPARYLKEIADFLGGSAADSKIDYTPVNAGKYSSTMDDETRRALSRYYAPCNERLFDILGHRVEEWNG